MKSSMRKETAHLRVGFPRMGTYTDIIESIGQYLNWDIAVPKQVADRTIETGAKYMNELMCLPAKVTLGSFIELCQQGVDDLVMFDSCGQCRLKTYYILQERALRKLGYNVRVHPVRLGLQTAKDLRNIDSSMPFWKSWVAFSKLLFIIKAFDKMRYIPDNDVQVKIGIVGEIYTILEPAVNRNTIHKLQKMGVFVHNSIPLSYFVFKPLYRLGIMKRPGVDRKIFKKAEKIAHQYFPKEIGGHGNEAIIHTIYYALKGFEGVLHILPFPCMPESTVAIILDEISHDYQIPVMRLIFDVQSGEAGLQTRLEAFTDILKSRKKNDSRK